MIEISKCQDKCFAQSRYSNCTILTEEWECSPRCAFYKPAGCEDWIRREKDGEIWLIPPEEFWKGKNHDRDQSESNIR